MVIMALNKPDVQAILTQLYNMNSIEPPSSDNDNFILPRKNRKGISKASKSVKYVESSVKPKVLPPREKIPTQQTKDHRHRNLTGSLVMCTAKDLPNISMGEFLDLIFFGNCPTPRIYLQSKWSMGITKQ